MDFQTLTRKDLQFLCKKNKIPANITNVAMADALTALENVVGLDEFINQSQSPEEIVPESESPLVTVNRTSTRRKPINEDPETAQPLTRTRRTTTRRTAKKDLDQENNNLNVPKSPAVPACRRRVPASKNMDTHKKENVEQAISCMIETPEAQTNRKRAEVASSRRKVEEVLVQRVYGTRQSVRLLEKTMAELSLKDKGRVEPVKMNDLNETEEKDMPAATFKKANNSEVSSSIELLENKEEIKDVVQQQNKSDDNSLDDQDNSDCLDNHLLEVNAKDDVLDQTSEDMLNDKYKKSNTDEMESVAARVTEFPYETENVFSEVVEKEHCISDNDEISAKVVIEDDAPDNVEAYQKDFLPFGDQLKSENDSELALYFKNTQRQSPAADDSPVDDDSGSRKSDGDQLDTTAVECVENVVNNAKVEMEEFDDTEEIIDVSLTEAEVPIFEDKTLEIVKQISPLASEENIPLSTLAADSISEGNTPGGYVEYPDSTTTNLVDVYVMPAEEFGKNPTPGKQSVSGGKFTFRNPMSPLGADPLPMQFPRPTQSTPISKKKQAINEKIIIVADNKENINSSSPMKVKSKMDKVKKNKNIVDEDIMLKSPLEDKSLRQLTKMLKEKLQINNKKKKINDEEENIVKTLPENLLLIPGEPKNEN